MAELGFPNGFAGIHGGHQTSKTGAVYVGSSVI